MPLATPSAGAVTIQVVLDHRPATSLRWLAAAAQAASVGLREGRISSWEIVLGVPDTSVFDRDAEARGAEIVHAANGELEVRTLGHDLGTASRHNLLAGTSTSDGLLFLEHGAFMAPDTVDRLSEAMTPDVGLVGARELPLEHDQEIVQFLGDTSWVPMTCALTPRASFVDLGGFDADTFDRHGADVDYSWRVRLSGLRVLLQPAARVFRDRRLRPNGDPQPPGWDLADKQQRQRFRAGRRLDTALGELLLALKYADEPRLTGLRAMLEAADGASRRALAEFDRRRAAGLLPSPVGGADRLAAPAATHPQGLGL